MKQRMVFLEVSALLILVAAATAFASRAQRRVRRCSRIRNLAVALAALVGVFAAGPVAFAYFTSSGSGSGTATTGTLVAPAVVSAITTANLIPNNGLSGLSVTLNNTNSYAVRIIGIEQNGTVSASSGSGTCATTGVSVPTNNTLNVPIASGNGVVVTVPGAVKMDTTSDSGCQGRTFTIQVKIAVQTP
jgi:hypothetical protein